MATLTCDVNGQITLQEIATYINDFGTAGILWVEDESIPAGYIKTYQGKAYVNSTDHTSLAGDVPNGAPDQPNQTNWTLIGPQQEHGGMLWVPNTEYRLGDTSTINDHVFISHTTHMSQPGDVSNGSPDQPNQANWIKVSAVETGGVAFKDTVEYKAGDVVTFNDKIYHALFDNGPKAFLKSDWGDTIEHGGVSWNDTETYNQGDLVTFNNALYVSLVTGNFNLSPDTNPTEWELYNTTEIGGVLWQDDTVYLKDTLVGFEDKAFICLVDHTSTSDDSTTGDPGKSLQTSWRDLEHIETAGVSWKIDVLYQDGDLVTENGDIYMSTRLHLSVNGDATDGSPTQATQLSWIPVKVSEIGGVLWRALEEYIRGDVVSKNGFLYYCVRDHLSSSGSDINGSPQEHNQTGWGQVRISEFGGKSYSSTHHYWSGDVVASNGKLYIAKHGNNTGNTPETSPADWHDTTQVLVYKGEWIPTPAAEYPTKEDHVYYLIGGVGSYTFNGGELAGTTTKDGDELIQGDIGLDWVIKPSLSIPVEVGGKKYLNTDRYELGDIVSHQGEIYTNTTPVTVLENFNPSKWEILDTGIKSDITQVSGAEEVTNIIKVTQTEYDNITPDPTTLYIIV